VRGGDGGRAVDCYLEQRWQGSGFVGRRQVGGDREQTTLWLMQT
jgi:hypothetical protein